MNKAICKNPWCKAYFEFESEIQPDMCWKCQSFNSDLSGGVTWTEKKYEGNRFDNTPHEIKINVTKPSDNNKRLW